VNTISQVVLVGEVESLERKVVKEKNVCEFRLRGLGLRISAWEARADAVPGSGIVAVTGYLSTRTYEYEGKQRESTEIRAMQVQAVEPGIDTEEPF
jgi:hypothetical protein